MACKSTTFCSDVEAQYRTGTANFCCTTRRTSARRLARHVDDSSERLRAGVWAPTRRTEPTDSLAAGLAWRSVMRGDPHKDVSSSMHPRSNSSELTARTARRRWDDFGQTGSDPCRREVLTTAQAAAVLGVHERTVRRYLSSGLLACRRLPGGHYRIPADSITAFWQENDASEGSQRRRPGRRARRAPDSSRTALERRAPSRSPRSRLRLGEDTARDYDLSTATLRALRARLS
jgi:excisionase family DNA binding protein